MTYIRGVSADMTDTEALNVRIHNTREWLDAAKQQAYTNTALLAFAIQELVEAIETLTPNDADQLHELGMRLLEAADRIEP